MDSPLTTVQVSITVLKPKEIGHVLLRYMYLRWMFPSCIFPGTVEYLTILSVFLASSQQLCISWSLPSGDNHDFWVCITMLNKGGWKCCNWFLLFSSSTDQLSQFLGADGVCIWSAGWGEQVLRCPPQISRLSGDLDFVWGMVWWWWG